MSSKPSRQNIEDHPALDEAWWAALLAEEEKYTIAVKSGPSAHRPGNGHGHEQGESPHAHQDHTQVAKQPIVDWHQAQKLFNEDLLVDLEVTGFNRGGLLVDGGNLHGFVPISHLVQIACDIDEEHREKELADYVGRSLALKVIECDPERGRVVFSERAALAVSGRRNQLLGELVAGECVRGVVTNITDFGVFVDLGGVEGLIHVSEISWGRVNHPTDVVQIGQLVTAYVISLDRDRSRIALSLKRLCSNPWDTAEQRYTPGQIVEVVITSVVPFGAFARLEEGLDGLIHITEVEGSLGLDRLKQMEGQLVLARILHIDAQRQRLGLSLNNVGH